jgi:hypothetical protein
MGRMWCGGSDVSTVVGKVRLAFGLHDEEGGPVHLPVPDELHVVELRLVGRHVLTVRKDQ